MQTAAKQLNPSLTQQISWQVTQAQFEGLTDLRILIHRPHAQSDSLNNELILKQANLLRQYQAIILLLTQTIQEKDQVIEEFCRKGNWENQPKQQSKQSSLTTLPQSHTSQDGQICHSQCTSLSDQIHQKDNAYLKNLNHIYEEQIEGLCEENLSLKHKLERKEKKILQQKAQIIVLNTEIKELREEYVKIFELDLHDEVEKNVLMGEEEKLKGILEKYQHSKFEEDEREKECLRFKNSGV